jgi:hypothetical protein
VGYQVLEAQDGLSGLQALMSATLRNPVHRER